MFYMKRAEKKITPPEITPVKAKKPIVAKISEQKKLTDTKKKTVIVAEKISKKSTPQVIAKTPITAPKVKKTVVDEKPKIKKDKTVTPVAVKKIVSKEKTVKTTIVNPVKPAAVIKKAKPAEKQQVEIVIPPIAPKPIKKKIKPIGSALVRGKSGQYAFEVFPLDAELKDGSAIYLISKRITDKSGRGHHKFVCIGQTESLLGDIKKHAKGKCIKQYKANVVCLLREENEKNRLKIETDLRQAHTIACNHQ